jgi:hypothetical protein
MACARFVARLDECGNPEVSVDALNKTRGAAEPALTYIIADTPANLTITEAGGGGAAVPDIGMWGLMLAAAGLGDIMVRRRNPLL